MLTNLIPLFLFNVLGVQTSIIGLIDGIAEATASLVKVYSGALSDRLGKRKTLTVLGYTLSTIAKPFLYFATTWQLVLGVRFTDRVGKGIRTAPRDALLAGSAKSDQRGLAFGLHRAGDTAGAFIGLGIAGLIIWLTQKGSCRTHPAHISNDRTREYHPCHPGSIGPGIRGKRSGSCQESWHCTTFISPKKLR